MPPRRSTREKAPSAAAVVPASSAAPASNSADEKSSTGTQKKSQTKTKPEEKKKEKAATTKKKAAPERKRKRDDDDDGAEAEAEAAAEEDEQDAAEDDEANDAVGTAAEAAAELEAAKAAGPAQPSKSWHYGERQKLQQQHQHTIAFLTDKVAILTKLEAGEPVDRSHPLFVDPRTLTAPQLQDQMRAWGLVASGARSELIRRFKNFVETGKAQNKRKKKRAVDSFDPKIEKNDPYYRHKAFISSLYNN